ncbi:MAG: hypothetical protein QOF71_246, partial [Candidatus Eremiobacteraeota bacterium]|nr:hypothetical protein [Candidatus Eremiobacteraeota bacterium]
EASGDRKADSGSPAGNHGDAVAEVDAIHAQDFPARMKILLSGRVALGG